MSENKEAGGKDGKKEATPPETKSEAGSMASKAGDGKKRMLSHSIYHFANRWKSALAWLANLIVPIIVGILLGTDPFPQSIPLFDFIKQNPIGSLLSGGVIALVSLAALIISHRREPTEESNVPNQSTDKHVRGWILATALSTCSFVLSFILLAVVVIRPPWCPSALCPPPELITNPKGIHDANLEVYLITVQSTSFVIPGDPASYSTSNLPENIGAERIDEKSSPFLYRVVLGVHSLQQGRFGIVLGQVNLVIRQVPPMPRPLSVWIKGHPVTFNTNSYKVIYQGQLAGHTLPAAYLPSPFGSVELAPGESDQLNLQVSSRVLADLQFQVQITYRVTDESQQHTLMLPYSFEVVFSDASNWRAYRLQSGHFVPTP